MTFDLDEMVFRINRPWFTDSTYTMAWRVRVVFTGQTVTVTKKDATMPPPRSPGRGCPEPAAG